jgi:hypothetical protein
MQPDLSEQTAQIPTNGSSEPVIEAIPQMVNGTQALETSVPHPPAAPRKKIRPHV